MGKRTLTGVVAGLLVGALTLTSCAPQQKTIGPQKQIQSLLDAGLCTETQDYLSTGLEFNLEPGEKNYYLAKSYVCLADKEEGAERELLLTRAMVHYYKAAFSEWGQPRAKREILGREIKPIEEERGDYIYDWWFDMKSMYR